MTVEIDSIVYRQPFYGILNAQGTFWTPLAFESRRKADEYLTEWTNVNVGRSCYDHACG